MKQITINLTDQEWKELCDTLLHELGELISENEMESLVKRGVKRFVRDTYIRSFA